MRIATAVFAACMTFAAAEPIHAAGKDEAAIRASSAAFLAAYNAGDANAVLTHFEDTAVVMPPNLPPLRGKAEIRLFVDRGIANAKAVGITLALAGGSEVGVSDKLAWHSGAYSASKAGAAIDDGKYLETWHKSGGTWRMIRRAWSSNHPPAAPAPAAAPK
jgi:ketosteroid isomerase-like protein